VFTIQKKNTVQGAVTAGLREFLDRGDAPKISNDEFQEIKITLYLREEKKK